MFLGQFQLISSCSARDNIIIIASLSNLSNHILVVFSVGHFITEISDFIFTEFEIFPVTLFNKQGTTFPDFGFIPLTIMAGTFRFLPVYKAI